jgi:hypothetical protein
MTQDEIIELAVFSGFFVKDNEAYSPSTQEDHELTPCLERFAKLVAEKERTWVGLTDDEIDKTLRVYEQDYDWISFAKAIEAKLKDKNGFAKEKNA